MELALQFGWGMMDHTKALLKEWGGGAVILSPRDLSDAQLSRFADEVTKNGGEVLLDPQFYLPHSDHGRLVAHDYWPTDYDSVLFWTGSQLVGLLSRLQVTNSRIGSSRFILPGLYATAVSDEWLAQQSAILEEAERVGVENATAYATVALSDAALSSNSQVEALLEGSRSWPAGGVYLICEHPRGDYLVQDPTWLANQIDLIAGWRLRGKAVLLGYSSHLNLLAASAGVNAIASGTWMNVRSFPPDKFRASYDDEIKRRTTWYYAPRALSEYKVPYLDIAARQGLLSDLEPVGAYANPHARPLFVAAQPSAAGFSEKDAFRHYLHCLRVQAESAAKPSFDATCAALRESWDQAEAVLSRLHAVGVTAQMRDFSESLDACRAALGVLEVTRGPILRREWHRLGSH